MHFFCRSTERSGAILFGIDTSTLRATIPGVKDLVDLEASLSQKLESQIRDLEITKSELKAVRATLALLTKVKASRAEAKINGAPHCVTNDEMRAVIASFTGEFESLQVTAQLRTRYPDDKQLSKKIARVLYDLRKEGKLHAQVKKVSGSKRFIYKSPSSQETT